MENRVKEKLGGRIVKWEKKNDRRFYLQIEKEDLAECARILFRELGMRFAIASGVDNIEDFEVLYHFACDEEGKFFSLGVKTDRDNPELPSLTGIIEGCKWIEREISELLGISFSGHPGLETLLLPEDWPEGAYPLRKDFTNEVEPGNP